MASKTKKKASKKTVSKKAAKKSTSTAAKKSAKKAVKKTTKKASKKGGMTGDVAHTPIIITDGSASIEFAGNEYPAVSATTHQSADLRLTQIISNKDHDNGTKICRTVAAGETVLIVVTCKVGGANPKTFNISGGNFLDGSGSPSIVFDHSAFDEPFPPMDPGNRVRRGKKNRDITKLEIFQVVGGANTLVHDCDVIAKKNFKIRVKDPHVH